jgi:hypothetical protein
MDGIVRHHAGRAWVWFTALLGVLALCLLCMHSAHVSAQQPSPAVAGVINIGTRKPQTTVPLAPPFPPDCPSGTVCR